MQVGIDARYIQDNYHGIGRYTFQLIKAILPLAPMHTFHLFYSLHYPNTRFNMEELWNFSNVRPHLIHSSIFHPTEQLEFRRAVRELALNTLHLPYISMPYLADCPVVLTVHDLIFERYPAYMPLKHTKLLYHLMMRSAVAKAAHIIVPTQATADDLAVFYKNTRGKTNSVAEGVDAAFQPVHSKAALASVRAKYNLPEQFILTIGTRRPHKNVEQLLAAFAALQHEIQSNLVLAGPVDARFPDNVMELADHWGIRQRVHFPGLIAEADLPALYSAAQVFVFPSRIEGFGLPVLEAMACGTPVIGSSTAAIVEVAGEAAAFLVDPDDVAGLTSSLRSVLNLSQEQCRKVCERAITHAENYSWEKTAAATLKIYEEVYARSLN